MELVFKQMAVSITLPFLLLLTGAAPAFGEGKNLKRFPDSAKVNYLKVDLSLLDET